jgi:hypothetical protein
MVLMLTGILCPAFGQEFSERQEIAIFRLSYYGQPVREPSPELRVEVRGRRGSLSVELRGSGDPQTDQLFVRAFGAVDERVRSVFTGLGRFDVIGMSQRLTEESVDDFIDVLSEYKRNTTELPEAVLLGQQTFTEADFRELAGDFVVVVPSVSWYSLTRNDDGSYVAEIETSFTFIDVANLVTFDQFSITTTGVDPQAESAVREAVNGIAGELSFRVRSMPEFQIKTGVLEVDGRQVILEFGRNMGLMPGDEYAIVSSRVLSTGHIATSETGLIVIREVQEGFSVGEVLYASPRVRVGDQLQEVARRGVELSGYLDVITDGYAEVTYAAGLRATVSRGFFAWRPQAAAEVPFRGIIAGVLLPVNLLVGGEWNYHINRLKLSPALMLGVGGGVPLSDDENLDSFYLSHLGGQARLTGSLLITRDIMLYVEAGFAYWAGLYGSPPAALRDALSSYGGLLIGGGVTFK